MTFKTPHYLTFVCYLLVIPTPPLSAFLTFEESRRRLVGRAGLLDGVPGLVVAALVADDVGGGRFALEVRALFGLDEFVAGLFLGGDELGGEVLVAVAGAAAVVARTDHLAVL